jgi:EAL domain-containing protein (putative c-di-GMP-specific phosphodiesterase class I)
MASARANLLPRIEELAGKIQKLLNVAETPEQKESLNAGLNGIARLAAMIATRQNCFGIEPWHPLHPGLPSPGEMLLRLKDDKGEAIPPYPVIMAFYHYGLASELDIILVLAAIEEFLRGPEQQISINIAARSLRNPDFVKTVHRCVQAMDLPQRKVIFEIHESGASLAMSADVLKAFHKSGVSFAIDDVSLNLNDVMRMAEFETIVDFIKLDRASVNAKPESPHSLDHVVEMVSAMMPSAVLVAEGVKSAEHAAALQRHHPAIQYAQGLYLPARAVFAAEWDALRAENPGIARPA